MRAKGKIAAWHDDKGYGFIAPFDGDRQVFMHIKALQSRSRRPAVNDVVTYDVSRDAQGRLRAENATLAGDRLRDKRKTAGSPAGAAVVSAAVFLAVVAVSVAAGYLPAWLLGVYCVMSVITFVVYASDKSAARSGDWRTSESVLHVLGLAGGWPGALVARQALRHKSRKKSFQIVFRATVVLNCGVLLWLHTAAGRDMLQLIQGN